MFQLGIYLHRKVLVGELVYKTNPKRKEGSSVSHRALSCLTTPERQLVHNCLRRGEPASGIGTEASSAHRQPRGESVAAPSPSRLMFQTRWLRKGMRHKNQQLGWWHSGDKDSCSSEGDWGAGEVERGLVIKKLHTRRSLGCSEPGPLRKEAGE